MNRGGAEGAEAGAEDHNDNYHHHEDTMTRGVTKKGLWKSQDAVPRDPSWLRALVVMKLTSQSSANPPAPLRLRGEAVHPN